MSEYHVPVMLPECMEGLLIDPNGIYVDLTFGGGGHSKEILKHLDKGHLYAFDQDMDAAENAKLIDSENFTFVEANFRYIAKYLRLYGVKKVDGILADLGVSSHQFDEETRGFSFRFDAELDMRMDRNHELTARAVINEYEEADLHKMFGMYGEVKNAKKLANVITRERIGSEIIMINDLLKIIEPLAPKFREHKYYAQVFQALRIEVNQEMQVLEEMLLQTPKVLKEDGRLVIMSYHSLEDRLVKNLVQKGKLHGTLEKDFYGNPLKPFDAVVRKVITATEQEVVENSRARSAKLRVAKRNDYQWETN
ncbi:MAG: 16S rRNA (cytosine(1402)-N(4))-methyltransferase RsmH [Cytophagales bacterium]|nr:16S rRNA (cytosine(1402)-N(4))-methyltransferase RsmH [Cytophagales bacterium]